MALDKSEVMVGTLDQTDVIGAVRWAYAKNDPTLPTLNSMNVSQGYTGLGYLVEDAFSIDFGNETETINEHNLGAVRVIKTGSTPVVTLKLLQTNAYNMGVMIGEDNVETEVADRTHGNQFKASFGASSIGEMGVLQILLKDGDRAAVILLPCAQVQNYSQVDVDAKDAIGWECEFVGLVDDSGFGLYILYDDGEIVSA